VLTGPIYIDGAGPGDVLEVRIQKIDLGVPYAMNMVGIFGNGIEIPWKPFFGRVGVAPPASAGRYNSAPPWIHAGNIDNKEFVAGTTLYIPVHVKRRTRRR
jgi:acetamidase/formamidase